MITTTGLDFKAYNTPHALMEEKFMQDFLSHPIFFFLHMLQININCYRHEIKFTTHALNASYHRIGYVIVKVSSIIGF